MEGFNWWGVFYFVMPIVLILITWIVFIIAMILDGVSKLIKKIKRYTWNRQENKRDFYLIKD